MKICLTVLSKTYEIGGKGHITVVCPEEWNMNKINIPTTDSEELDDIEPGEKIEIEI